MMVILPDRMQKSRCNCLRIKKFVDDNQNLNENALDLIHRLNNGLCILKIHTFEVSFRTGIIT